MARLCVLFGLLVALAGCRRTYGAPPAETVPRASSSSSGATARPSSDPLQRGQASWYGEKFRGRKTASGERFDPDAMTAAHRTLKFGTWVEVTRVDTGASVRVRITDRGPFGKATRIIDLSKGAADALGMIKRGVADVELRVLE